MSTERIRAVLLALLCALLIGAGPAQAATIVGDTTGLAVADIRDRTGTLTITLTPGNPYDDLQPGGVAGVEFTARRVSGIDLLNDAGWFQARAMTLSQAAAAEHDVVRTALTDARGIGVFEGLPVGLYLVTATASHGVRVPQDMLLTIPVGQEGTWNYDVLINAKYQPDVPVTPTVPVIPPATPTWQPPTIQLSEVPIEPGTPGSPGAPVDSLPVTGASVLTALGIAIVLVALGTTLLLINRRPITEKA
ncbi:hypothetical protein [Corynebacterium sp.]|uniref:hypothetical protein n=1 Tax=Corynebacterium sp. TaxID=1720 RepID=UPI0026DFAB03|nr:hypothetical protein [Corynebacterium sp.]MDO5512036.1 hypothetical protein [Corynebacterium sp.]